jgi:hypothetical protein
MYFPAPQVHADIQDGLISCWPLDEGTGLNATDPVGGNDGTLTFGGSGTQRPQWTDGKFGGALDFDGIGAYVNCGSDASLKPTTVTVAAWIKTDYYVYYGQIAGYATDTGASESGYSIITEDVGYLGAWLTGSSGDGWYLWTTDVPPYPNTDWVHVALTYDGATSILYVNGDSKATSTHSGDIDYDHVGYFLIGTYDDPIGSYWFPYQGLIDDVAVWGRALTQQEIDWLYNGGNGNSVLGGGYVYVQVTESGDGTSVTEGGAADSYEVVLGTEPTQEVQITATPGDGEIDLGAGAGAAVMLTFDAGNWDIPKTITVNAYNDDVYEGKEPHVVTINHSANGGEYTGIDISSVEVEVTDNELICGDWGYMRADINKDCYVDMLDFAEFASQWMLNQPQ